VLRRNHPVSKPANNGSRSEPYNKIDQIHFTFSFQTALQLRS
jgi:hypothetical protein